jgi:LCP family protein required for cell wall assembly
MRRVAKVLAWLVAIVLVAGGGVAGGVWLYVNEEVVEPLRPDKGTDLASQDTKNEIDVIASPDAPAVALVIGYDVRKGADAAGFVPRSDTVMLMRADPKEEVLTLLSLPRDLWVEHPGCKATGWQGWEGKINEAYTRCKARGVIRTVKKLTGLPINYVITVNFAAFRSMVDKVGGVWIDVDRRYFNDQGGPGGYATVDLQPGYQRLSGTLALDYARYRHQDNDVFRTARQQVFVRAFKQRVKDALAPQKLPGFIRVVVADDNLKIQQGGRDEIGVDTLLRWGTFLNGLGSGSFYQVRIDPNRLGQQFFGGQDALIASPELIEEAVSEFLAPDPDVAKDAARVATGQKRGTPPPRETTVEVLNGNGEAGAAADAAERLRDRGYLAESGGEADNYGYFDTQVVFDPGINGAELAAKRVADLFGGNAEPAAPDVQLSTMLRVIVGKTYENTIAPGVRDRTPERQAADTVADGETMAPLAQGIQRLVDFPVLVPTKRDRLSFLDDDSGEGGVRMYRVNGGYDAVKLVYQRGDIHYWGIQQTSWEKAPILEGANAERRIKGRLYKLYFSGPRLHMVAFEENGAVYWVTNTLDDTLSNETMLDIAKGLRPLDAVVG